MYNCTNCNQESESPYFLNIPELICDTCHAKKEFKRLQHLHDFSSISFEQEKELDYLRKKYYTTIKK